jgi:hypothetical protein
LAGLEQDEPHVVASWQAYGEQLVCDCTMLPLPSHCGVLSVSPEHVGEPAGVPALAYTLPQVLLTHV